MDEKFGQFMAGLALEDGEDPYFHAQVFQGHQDARLRDKLVEQRWATGPHPGMPKSTHFKHYPDVQDIFGTLPGDSDSDSSSDEEDDDDDNTGGPAYSSESEPDSDGATTDAEDDLYS